MNTKDDPRATDGGSPTVEQRGLALAPRHSRRHPQPRPATSSLPACGKGGVMLADAWFFIPEIHKIMHNQKPQWKMSEKFQKIWLSGKARQLGSTQREGLDTKGLPLRVEMIKMAWALTFDRAKKLFEEVQSPDVFLDVQGRKNLADVIRRKVNKDADIQIIRFGNYHEKNPRDREKEFCKARGLGIIDGLIAAPLDDFFGAIGEFAFFVIAKGVEDRVRKNVTVEVSEIGIYIRDSFDFNDSDGAFAKVANQLGTWTKPDQVTKWPLKLDNLFPRCSDKPFSIENSDYRKYRERTGMGEDFIIYSDVKRVIINKFKFNFQL